MYFCAMKTFWRIMAFAPPFWSYGPLYLLTGALAVVFGAVNIALLIPLLNVLFDTAPPAPVATLPPFALSVDYGKQVFSHYFNQVVAQHGKFAALQFVCAVLVGSVLLANVFTYWSQRIMNRTCQDLVRNLRGRLYDHLLYMHLGYFSTERKGDLMARVTNDVQEIEYTAITVLKSAFREPLTILVFFGMLFYISVELTVFTILFLPISGGLIAYISKQLRKEGRERQSVIGNLLNLVEETLGGLKIINAFNARAYFQERFQQRNTEYRNTTKGLENKRDLASPVSQVMGVLVVAGILLYGGSLVLGSGQLAAADFIAYVTVFTQILTPAKALTVTSSTLNRGVASMERVLEVLATPPVIRNLPGAKPVAAFHEHLVFDQVGFSYGDQPVLRNLNLTVRKGQTIALVGPSGGGKTTLADLVPRFYDPTQGRILLDGQPLPSLDLDQLRGLMGIVTQDPVLFNDTVFNNIAFGLPHVGQAEVERAARIAHAHEFIMTLENGYQTNVGDRGSRLSGGQRQRLSIARAVLKNPPLLILDEATSALDSESERLVQAALEQLMQGRTSLVIAHRLSTIQNADLIVVLQQGQIVEQGTHAQLLAQGGLYTKLSQLQAV